MATKQEIMAALLAEKERSNKGNKNSKPKTSNNTGDNASYPFWNIGYDEMAVLRFLPDGDPNNTYFWREKQVIKLPFEGVEGGEYPTNKQVTVTVPCMDMWEPKACPIIQGTKTWWDDPKLKALAKVYWKKKTYIFQGFVVSSDWHEENPPENPIRRFMINKSLFPFIEKAIMDTEMEDLPTDLVGGTDFRIKKVLKKTPQGDYANYDSSEWSRKSRSLNETELSAIEQFKLYNLDEYRGRRPDSDEAAAIKQMFEDSKAGRPFDVASFGQWFRAYTDKDANGGGGEGGEAGGRSYGGDNGGNGGGYSRPASTPAPAPAARAPAPVEEEEYEAPAPARAAPAAEKSSTANAHEILERIKNRTMNKG